MKRLGIVLRMIKFEHTVFALPFAFLGAFLASRGAPEWRVALWILLAMVGARSAAMGFNRLVDRHLDAQNPRTLGRALPRGRVSPTFVAFFVILSSALFLFSAWRLNRLAFELSPLALALVLLYSYTKRFTALSHMFLGLALSVAPVGGWVAVRGRLESPVFWVAGAVLVWVAGFDIIYACQDLDFDRRRGLHSIPGKLGVRAALAISRGLHVMMVLLLAAAFWQFRLSAVSWIGLLAVSAALVYEHSLVGPEKMERLEVAFFTVNSLISLILFFFVGLDLCLVA